MRVFTNRHNIKKKNNNNFLNLLTAMLAVKILHKVDFRIVRIANMQQLQLNYCRICVRIEYWSLVSLNRPGNKHVPGTPSVSDLQKTRSIFLQFYENQSQYLHHKKQGMAASTSYISLFSHKSTSDFW